MVVSLMVVYLGTLPENGWLEYEDLSYWVVSAYFQERLNLLLVSGRVKSVKKKHLTLPETNIAPENRPPQ